MDRLSLGSLHVGPTDSEYGFTPFGSTPASTGWLAGRSACRWNDTRACGVNISGPAPTFGASMTTCPSLVLCADSGENCVAVSSLRRGGNDSKHSTDILGDGVGAICLCTCRIHSPLHSCSSWQNAINHRIAPHACIMSMTRKSVRTPTYAYLSACVLPLPLVLVCR